MSASIAILVEGRTEKAFKPILLEFLKPRLIGKMPRLVFIRADGRIPKENKLKRVVQLLLRANDAVVALTDVYTGSSPRDFANAAEARAKMREWVGPERHFYPHAAQHDFEAWLLPYWPQIKKIAGSDKAPPSSDPESVNHDKPPAKFLAEVFRLGSARDSYSKIRDAVAILRGQDLSISAEKCPELKAFLNTILTLSGGEPL